MNRTTDLENELDLRRVGVRVGARLGSSGVAATSCPLAESRNRGLAGVEKGEREIERIGGDDLKRLLEVVCEAEQKHGSARVHGG